MTAHEEGLDQLQSTGEELADEGHYAKEEIMATLEKVAFAC